MDGISYTTVGHEPFSIHNVLDQDVFQFTDNFNIYLPDHILTLGVNFEKFKFDNSFNLFYYGFFGFANNFTNLQNFFDATDPTSPNFRDYNKEVAGESKKPFNLAITDVGQLAFYVQDEYKLSEQLKLTGGLRIDKPVYFSTIEPNPLVAALTFRDADGNPEKIDVSRFPKATFLFSPRVGFNWDIKGDRSTQLRGGTGVFTGRLPFVWIGNQAANRGSNDPTNIGAVNAAAENFKFPQVWKTDLALDQILPWGVLGTFEALYGKDINAVIIRNANLAAPVGRLAGPDNRLKFGGAGANAINPTVSGAYILDNTSEGYQYSLTAQFRKNFDFGLSSSLGYTYGQSKDKMTSTEIAQFLFEGNPIQQNPNKPELSYSEFGLEHNIIGSLLYRKEYAQHFATSVAVFFQAAQGGRYSYTYSGDLNGDGVGGNDLIYIPRNSSEILFAGTPAEQAAQWQALNSYIEQDDYLKAHRGSIAEKNGAKTPWFSTIDLKILQDFYINIGGKRNTIQLSLDILNLGNLINSDWGIIEVPTVRQPLTVAGFTKEGQPIFQYSGANKSFRDDVSVASRFQAQFGIRYIFN